MKISNPEAFILGLFMIAWPSICGYVGVAFLGAPLASLVLFGAFVAIGIFCLISSLTGVESK